MKKLKKILFLFVSITYMVSCQKDPKYSTTPLIDFQQITVSDSTDDLGNKVKNFQIAFQILDGDWDFGITENDTLVDYYHDSTYANNFFATLYYQDENGNPQPFPTPIPLTGAIPYTLPIGIHSFYKALIFYDLPVPPLNKTLKLKFYVIDRHLHKSNEQETPWIPDDFTGIMIDTVTLIPQTDE